MFGLYSRFSLLLLHEGNLEEAKAAIEIIVDWIVILEFEPLFAVLAIPLCTEVEGSSCEACTHKQFLTARATLRTNWFSQEKQEYLQNHILKVLELRQLYYIRLMSNLNNKAARIKRPFPDIEEQLITQIRSQIEFYFAMANLVTDRFLKGLIESDRRGWVSIRELLHFPCLRLLLLRAFQKPPSLNEIEHLVGMAVAASERVQADKGRVKLRKRMVWERDCMRVLYFEGAALEEGQIAELLAAHQVPASSYTTKSGDGWLFVDFWRLSEAEVLRLHQDVKPTCSERKVQVLLMREFRQFEQRYDQLLPAQDGSLRTAIRIPPSQLLRCDEIVVASRPKGPAQKPAIKQINYQKIFSKYVKSRNKKTPEAYEKHREEKIAERRRERQLKRVSSNFEKMEIEE